MYYRDTLEVDDIRDIMAEMLADGDIVVDETKSPGFQRSIEIVGASFIASEDHIFGAVNHDYVQRELEWYKSQSLNVNDIPGGTPAIWKQVADPDGFINSNYGWAILSDENGNQYDNALTELIKTQASRRALMIYTRPNMWTDFNKNGRSDFMCTNAVQFLIRDNSLTMVVQMRSNDAWAGYRNDYAWQRFVQEKMLEDLKAADPKFDDLELGDIHWQVGSLHVYENQFYLVKHWYLAGETSITKKEYAEIYGEDDDPTDMRD